MELADCGTFEGVAEFQLALEAELLRWQCSTRNVLFAYAAAAMRFVLRAAFVAWAGGWPRPKVESFADAAVQCCVPAVLAMEKVGPGGRDRRVVRERSSRPDGWVFVEAAQEALMLQRHFVQWRHHVRLEAAALQSSQLHSAYLSAQSTCTARTAELKELVDQAGSCLQAALTADAAAVEQRARADELQQLLEQARWEIAELRLAGAARPLSPSLGRAMLEMASEATKAQTLKSKCEAFAQRLRRAANDSDASLRLQFRVWSFVAKTRHNVARSGGYLLKLKNFTRLHTMLREWFRHSMQQRHRQVRLTALGSALQRIQSVKQPAAAAAPFAVWRDCLGERFCIARAANNTTICEKASSEAGRVSKSSISVAVAAAATPMGSRRNVASPHLCKDFDHERERALQVMRRHQTILLSKALRAWRFRRLGAERHSQASWVRTAMLQSVFAGWKQSVGNAKLVRWQSQARDFGLLRAAFGSLRLAAFQVRPLPSVCSTPRLACKVGLFVNHTSSATHFAQRGYTSTQEHVRQVASVHGSAPTRASSAPRLSSGRTPCSASFRGGHRDVISPGPQIKFGISRLPGTPSKVSPRSISTRIAPARSRVNLQELQRAVPVSAFHTETFTPRRYQEGW